MLAGVVRPADPELASGEEAAHVALMRQLFQPSEDVYADFNNDYFGCAVRDAGVFERLCWEVGLDPTPVTAPVTVGAYSRR